MTRLSPWILIIPAVVLTPACSTAPGPAPALSAEDRAAAQELNLQMAGLSCPLCATNADMSLLRLPGVLDAETDLSTGEVRLWVLPAAAPPPQAIEAAVLDAGFTVAQQVGPGVSGQALPREDVGPESEEARR